MNSSIRDVVVVVMTFMLTCSQSFQTFPPSLLVQRSLLRMSTLAPPHDAMKKAAPKVVSPTVVESRQVYTVEIPDISEIENRAIHSKRSSSSKEFCTRSGGYPDVDIKTDIYTLLYATQIRNYKEKQAAFLQDRSFIKYGSNEEDLETWGM